MEALKARAAQGCPHAKAQLDQMAEKAKATVLQNVPVKFSLRFSRTRNRKSILEHHHKNKKKSNYHQWKN